jgi:hypothetical protein
VPIETGKNRTLVDEDRVEQHARIVKAADE